MIEMIGFIGAGQMRHQQFGACLQHEGGDCLPFGFFHAKPVHAGIKLHAKGMAGQRFQMPGDLLDRVQHRRQVKIVDHVGITRHMPRQDADLRPRPKRLTQGRAFFGHGDEKAPRTGMGQRARHPCDTKAIGISLDHGGRLHARGRGAVKRAPVGDDCVKIDGQMSCGHGQGF